MKSHSLKALAAWGPLALAFQGPVPAVPAQQDSPGQLERVAPDVGQPDASRDVQRLFTKQFERSEWLARLAEPDLDARERSLDLLLQRARLDPVARAFLEELGRDPRGGELAWTARLALRQLGRVKLPLHFVLPGNDPFGGHRMQQVMEEILGQGGQGLFFRPGPPTPSGPAASALAGRRVHVEQGAKGARIRISESAGGKEVARDYEGESLEAILRDHPELEQELAGLQIRAQAGTGLDLRFDLEGARGSDGAERLRRSGAEREGMPRGRSRPIITDRLGVIVQALDPERAAKLGLEHGLLVGRTYPETYAQLLGVGAGSILLELDGTPLFEAADIERALCARQPDDPLRLIWLDELGQRQERTWQP